MENDILKKILVIDQSTSATKVALVSEKLEILIMEYIEHEQICAHPGWTEHDPNTLIQNINSCIEKIISQNHVKIISLNKVNRRNKMYWDH